MDDFNVIELKSTNIECAQVIDDSRMREFRNTHPETINRIEDSYDSETNTVTAVFYSDSIISSEITKKYYYIHSRIIIVYQPCTKRNETHDSIMDNLIKRMSKFGGWVSASINNAVIKHFKLDEVGDRGYGH